MKTTGIRRKKLKGNLPVATTVLLKTNPFRVLCRLRTPSHRNSRNEDFPPTCQGLRVKKLSANTPSSPVSEIKSLLAPFPPILLDNDKVNKVGEANEEKGESMTSENSFGINEEGEPIMVTVHQRMPCDTNSTPFVYTCNEVSPKGECWKRTSTFGSQHEIIPFADSSTQTQDIIDSLQRNVDCQASLIMG